MPTSRQAPTSSPIVLLSGGIDSAVLAHRLKLATQSPLCLFVDYGQAAATHERLAARKIASHLGLTFRSLKTIGLPPSSTGFVPARNLLLLSLAASLAGTTRPPLIAVGIIAGSASYPDTSVEFLDAMQRTLDFYHRGALRIAAPLIGWSKSTVVQRAES